MKKTNLLYFIGIVLCFASCNDKYPDLKDGLYAEFTTNRGIFLAELYYEQTPLTVANFVSLAEGTNTLVDTTYRGKHFYDDLIFHRVIKDFMIQGGDPLGTGQGGPGYKFPDEFVDSLKLDSKGILAMANAGPGTNGSQFFITLKETPWLNGRHTVFGHIVKGQEVVDSIGVVETAKPGDKPVEDVIIQKVEIIRKGDDAKNFDAATVFSSEMNEIEKEQKESAKKMEMAKSDASKNFEKIKADAETLPSGLAVYFNKKSNGEKPEKGATVGVYYEGYLSDGTLFDTNKEEVAKKFGMFNERRAQANGYVPMPMQYSSDARMIPGFKEGVLLMDVGDVATLFIPSHLGYGKQGQGPIPPGADLIFKVELAEIMK
ncbi:MAG TPA: peptidylprolyl isomerase [Flavobacteriaceae bacterium]|nr:peptidylprolyl isomerase [Flavobacteriaceae bacterium]